MRYWGLKKRFWLHVFPKCFGGIKRALKGVFGETFHQWDLEYLAQIWDFKKFLETSGEFFLRMGNQFPEVGIKILNGFKFWQKMRFLKEATTWNKF